MTDSEPGLPADNKEEAARETDTKVDSQEHNRQEPDALPRPLDVVFASLWVLLFGGRWLFVPLLQAAGALSVEQVAAWDAGLLYKTYLILLFLTCIALALRATRHAPSSSEARKDETREMKR